MLVFTSLLSTHKRPGNATSVSSYRRAIGYPKNALIPEAKVHIAIGYCHHAATSSGYYNL